jgi:hypothetical protein
VQELSISSPCGSLHTHRHVSLEGAGRGGGYCVVTFYCAQAVLHCAQGTLLSFDAALTHAGMPIQSGARYLLVGFCHTRDPAAAHAPGNLALIDLRMMTATATTTTPAPCAPAEPVALVWKEALGPAAVERLLVDALQLDALLEQEQQQEDLAPPDAAAARSRSFWLGAAQKPRTALEVFALAVRRLPPQSSCLAACPSHPLVDTPPTGPANALARGGGQS